MLKYINFKVILYIFGYFELLFNQ